MHDEKMFKEYMTGLGELHQRNITDVIKNMYWKILAPYTDEQCKQAFEIVIRECSFFPKPSELLKYIAEKQEDKAITSLNLVVYAVEHVGNYTSVKFPDPAIHSVIEMLGGWPKFCTATEEEWVWLKKDFLKFYPTLAKKQTHSDYLPGQFEIDNMARGSKWYEKPKLITLPQPHKKIEQPKIENQAIELEAPKMRPIQELLMSTFNQRRAA